jgi:MFS family permease
VKGYTPLAAALATSGPICLVNFLWMPHAPRMIERFTAKWMIVVGIGFISCAVAVIATTSADSSYLNLFIGFALMALAFSTFTPASTEAIMTAMPAQKAGAASSINQMTRQLGQALGIAVVGSVAASAYRSGFDVEEIDGVAPTVVESARESITGAIQAVETLEGDARSLVLEAAQNAFTHGMQVALAVTAGLAVLAALYAAKVIPNGRADEMSSYDADEALAERLVD